LGFFMKNPLSRLGKIAAFLALGSLAHAITPGTGPTPPPGGTPGLGVTIKLTTGGSRFLQPSPSPAPTATPALRLTGTAPPPGRTGDGRVNFPASVCLANHSRLPIDFEFADTGAAERKFVFRLYDAADQLVWESLPDVVSAPVVTPLKLLSGAMWHRTVLVPLVGPDGPLAIGSYKLEASIDGTPLYGATASLQIVARPDPTPTPTPKPTPTPRPTPSPDTGIRGVVLQGPIQPVTTAGTDNTAPVPGALVMIQQLRPDATTLLPLPFVWKGTANENGEFEKTTPPGRFRVRAVFPITTAIYPPPPPRYVEKIVEVTAGAFTSVEMVIDTGIR
jgi:hypothetical protein